MRKSERQKNILIVRLSPMSDVAIASPIAEIIKKYNPNASITWITQSESAELVQNNPHIDHLLIWPRDEWHSLWRQKKLLALLASIKAFKHQFNGKSFELAIDLQGLLKSGFLTWLSGAKQRLGVGSRESSHWFTHKMVSRNSSNRDRVGSEYRYLLNQLGYLNENWRIRIYPDSPSIAKCESLIRSHVGESPYAVILPFGKSTKHLWPEEHWRQLTLRIRGRYQLKTFVIGLNHEKVMCQKLAKQCGAINLTGDMSLEDATHIIERAAITIGIENAFTHIAQSTENPSIALFGASCPYVFTGNENSKIIYLDRYCSPCKTPICNSKFPCMSEISPDQVLNEIKKLMNLNLFDTIKVTNVARNVS